MNCYILIGGQSRRLGQSKPALFLDRVARAASGVFDKVIAVQRAGGQGAEIIETIFEEEHDEQAPVFGVGSALRHAPGDCFILAVDYPLVTAEVLRYIEGRFVASTAPMVAPRWNGKLQMLCAGYSKTLLPMLEERIASHRFDLRGLADGAEVIEEPELRRLFSGEPLMNVNTPEELEKVKTLS